MKKKKKYLVLRFNENLIENGIKKHLEILEKYGVVWYCKFGRRIGPNTLNAFMNEENPQIILYSKKQKNLFVFDVAEYTNTIPNKYYPAYYDKKILNTDVPKLFFKFTKVSIEPMDETNNLYIYRNGKNLQETLNNSFGTFFLAIYDYKKDLFPCLYKKDLHICMNPKCIVNYERECINPRYCPWKEEGEQK